MVKTTCGFLLLDFLIFVGFNFSFIFPSGSCQCSAPVFYLESAALAILNSSHEQFSDQSVLLYIFHMCMLIVHDMPKMAGGWVRSAISLI